MATLKQIEANRRNVRKSTRPNPPQGQEHRQPRTQFSMDLLAANPVCFPEEQVEHEKFVAGLRDHWRSDGCAEALALDRMIDCAWRLSRVTKIETSLLCGIARNWRKKQRAQQKTGILRMREHWAELT